MNNSAYSTKTVIDEAKFVTISNWNEENDIRNAAKQLAAIKQLWQDRMVNLNPERFKKNVKIGGKLTEEFDLVDYQEKVAYEFKPSANHFFYKDLFKAIIFNQHHNITKIKRLVFIAEPEGIEALEKGLAKASADFLQKYDIAVELARIE